MLGAIVIRIVTAILCAIAFFPPLQAFAQSDRDNYLNETILLEKTANLTQQEGKETIDLSNYIIDLTESNRDFNKQFYQEINNTIGRSGKPVSINFDGATFIGDFQLNRLGITSFLGKAAISSLFTPLEQEQINRYYPVNNSGVTQIPRTNIFRGSLYFNNAIFTGEVEASNCLFLQPVTAIAAKFQAPVHFDRTIFGKESNFSQTIFETDLDLSQSHFFAPAKFKQAEFNGVANCDRSRFDELIEFNGAIFRQLADFSRSVFMETVDFSQTNFQDRSIFAKSKFLATVIFTDSTFEKSATFRDIYISSSIDLQEVHLLDRIDFSNAFFAFSARIYASGLAFDAAEAKIIGQPGTIGKLIQVDQLSGNETVLGNLIRNFRSLEQIADANLIEYQQEQLRAKQLSDRLTSLSWQKIFSWTGISWTCQWLSLNLLLLIGDYGTNINSIFSIGIITIAFFSLLFWLIDRYRPGISRPIIPTGYEIAVMLGSYFTLTTFGIINIFTNTDRPWLTLITVATVLIPLPVIIIGSIYQRGRYHQLLDTSYFVENGEFRQFRLLLGRLPIIPRFPFFRDRFSPILWDKRWNWLNYYDFSLNNIFKLGFNDIRLRDRHLPGQVSTLVWYQWCLGVLYVVLLLWTLSRTIPGLNLLLYF